MYDVNVQAATGEIVTSEELGGALMHSRYCMTVCVYTDLHSYIHVVII